MKKPNPKEALVLKAYKEKIENREFDEHDIISFLIYIRSLLENTDKNKYWNIYDLCDFVAHRERSKGKTQAGIVASIDNNYQTETNSKRVKGYDGIEPEDLKKELSDLGRELGITITDEVFQEISICVLSMLQFSTFFRDKNNHTNPIATMVVQQGEDYLVLCSTEGTAQSEFVCYFRVDNLSFQKKYNIIVDDALFAKRVDGQLQLVNEHGSIVV